MPTHCNSGSRFPFTKMNKSITMIYANNIYIYIYLRIKHIPWFQMHGPHVPQKTTQNGTLVFPRFQDPWPVSGSVRGLTVSPGFFGTIPSFSYLRIAGEGCTVDEYVYVTCIDICFHVYIYIYINTSIDVYSNMCIIYDYVFIDKQISTVCICICTYVYVTVNFWKAFRIAESMAQRLPSTASPQLSLNGTSFCLASFLKNEGRGIFFGKTQHQCHARPFWLLATKHLPEFLKSWRHHYPKQGPPKKNATHGGRSYSSRLVAHES